MPFFQILFDFYLIFSRCFLFKKSRKRGFYLQVLTWRVGTTGADVARGTTSKVRRGIEATWQSSGGPRRAQEAHSGVATWQGATRPRESTWAPMWGAMWQVGW